jgi:phi13 family phage major tail protein
MAENKVQFGLKNVHYATFTESGGVISYDAPIPIPGAVEISLEARGDMVEFYADDVLYYSASNNQGYDGTLNIAVIPESYAIDCLGEEKDPTAGVLIEKVTAKGKPFALMFEFDGDVKATRHVLYNCTASRPTVGSSTKTDSVEPGTSELTFVASARSTDDAVKTKTTGTTSPTVYNNWYTEVYSQNAVAVTSVTLVPDTLSLTVGAVQQLAATVLPANATNKGVLYTTSDATKATVSSSGLVTAVAAGTATITVTTSDGSFTDTCAVTVTT